MCGIGPAHIRRLCDNVFEGGFGFTPNEVGNMTLDQIFMLLADKRNLRSGKHRANKVQSFEAASYADKEGFIKGRDKDGKEIKAKIVGKSLVQRINEGEVAYDLEGNRIEPKPEKKKRLTRQEKKQQQKADQARVRELMEMIRKHSQNES